MADLDHKIDEFRAEMREGFGEVRAEFKNVRSEIKEVRSEVELRADLGAPFSGLERSITALWVSLTGGMAAFVAALIATNL